MESAVLYEKLEKFQSGDKVKLNMYLIERKKNTKSIEYITHNVRVAKDFNQEIIAGLMGYALTQIHGKDLQELDAEISKSDVIDFVKKEDVPYLCTMNNQIDANTEPTELNSETIANIFCSCFVIKNEAGEEIRVFRKYRGNTILKNKWLGIFKNNVLSKMVDNAISIENSCDVILYSGKAYILNRYYFEIMFSYNEQYKKVLSSQLEKIESYDIIEGFQEFQDDCLNSNSVAKKFTNIARKNCIDELMSIREDEREIAIKAAIKKARLSLGYADGKIIYTGKEDLKEMVTLLGDKFVNTMLLGKDAEAEGINYITE